MTVDELQKSAAYHLLLMLPHDDILPFVREQFSNGTLVIRFYGLFNVVLLLLMMASAFQDINNGLIGWGEVLGQLGLGTLLVFTLLIPIHEGLHGLAYKIVGAPRVSYGVNWKMFYFYAVADRFVVGRNSFYFIGLTPFVIVSLLAILGFFFASVKLNWMLWGVLFMHTTACAGDFALLSFFEKNKDMGEIWTYDDVREKRSYFYVKNE